MTHNILDSLGKWHEIRSPEKRKEDYFLAHKEDLNENLEDLNNLGHEEITEDFSDSPSADRLEEIEDELSTENNGSSDGSLV